MKILVKKIPNLEIPKRAHSNDAGYDIIAASEPEIVGIKYERITDGIMAWSKIDYIEYKTNLFIAPQSYTEEDVSDVMDTRSIEYKEFHTLIYPRSSISKKNLVLANSVGIIDNSYRGEILVRFKYVFQPEDWVILPEMGRTRMYAILNTDNVYKKGDKIAQIKPCANIGIDFELVENLDQTKRGSGGFGSTN